MRVLVSMLRLLAPYRTKFLWCYRKAGSSSAPPARGLTTVRSFCGHEGAGLTPRHTALGRHRVGLLVNRHALLRARDVLTYGTRLQSPRGGRERLGLTPTAPGSWCGECHRGRWRIRAQARKRQ